MTSGPAPLCVKCKHYHESDYDKHSCDAFPGGIPKEIILSAVDHTSPYPGDNGIRFEPIDAATEEPRATG